MTDRQKELAETLKMLREHSGIRAAELARRANWDSPMVSTIESGRYRMRVDTLARYANALGAKAVVTLTMGDGKGGCYVLEAEL